MNWQLWELPFLLGMHAKEKTEYTQIKPGKSQTTVFGSEMQKQNREKKGEQNFEQKINVEKK